VNPNEDVDNDDVEDDDDDHFGAPHLRDGSEP